jgi:hypothetical protein
MQFYKNIRGVDVWVTVEQPAVFDEAQGGYVVNQYCCAFKYHAPPGHIVGEYLRHENGQLQWFANVNAARDEGFDEADGRIP